jgi:hypothetical protein
MARPPLSARTVTATAAEPREFAWPEFDRWQAFFAAHDTFPAGWDGLHVAPPPRTPEAEAYEHRKLDLFSEWLDMLARRTTVLAHYTRHGLTARIVRQHPYPACPACDPFDAREIPAVLETMPPFHPGCRCVVLAVHRTPSRRRAG